ncbi:MAG TPA: VOC family protein [Pyrinomonadaceae bacterium]|nr:VOC family protein [Pyrinomonadaceae bacterium]
MESLIEFVSAVLIYSTNVDRSSQFYGDVLGIPLEEEIHGEGPVHYGCELGDIHFAIHPSTEISATGEAGHRFKLAFTIFSTEALLERLSLHGIPILYSKKTEFAVFTAIRDPDGNHLEFTEFSDEWFEHLESRRARGIDILARWKVNRANKPIP